MSWSDDAQDVRTACLDTFGLAAGGKPLANLFPAEGGGPYPFDGIYEKPALFEDALPGSVEGVSVVRFRVDIDNLNPQPVRGDQVVLAGIRYDIHDVKARPEASSNAGATLMLRKRS